MLGQFQFHTPRVVAALVLREMSTTYGRSVGGYLWALLEPIGGILLLTVCFSLALRAPPLGSSFAIFYATGIVPFTVYSTTQSKVSQSIGFSKGLLSYPRVTFFDAVLARFLLNAMTQMIVATVIFSGLFIITGTPVTVDMVRVAQSLALAAWLGFGLGVLNCFLFSIIPIWKNFWAILTRPLFIMSGLFFIFEEVPEKFQHILWWNPLIHIIGNMRQGFFPTYHPAHVSLTYAIWFAAIPTVLGLFLLRRYHKMILNEL